MNNEKSKQDDHISLPSSGVFVSRNWLVSVRMQLQQNHLWCFFEIVSHKMHL